MSYNGAFLLVSSRFVDADDAQAEANYAALMNDLRDRFGIYDPTQDLMIYPVDETSLREFQDHLTMPTLHHDRRHIERLLKDPETTPWRRFVLDDMIEKMRGIREICARHSVDVYYTNEYEEIKDQQDLDAGLKSGDIVELTDETINAWASRIIK